MVVDDKDFKVLFAVASWELFVARSVVKVGRTWAQLLPEKTMLSRRAIHAVQLEFGVGFVMMVGFGVKQKLSTAAIAEGCSGKFCVLPFLIVLMTGSHWGCIVFCLGFCAKCILVNQDVWCCVNRTLLASLAVQNMRPLVTHFELFWTQCREFNMNTKRKSNIGGKILICKVEGKIQVL